MRVTSITRVLPTPDDPQCGLFVERRLRAMAEQMSLRVLQPVPYFPFVRPLPDWAAGDVVPGSALAAQPVPMFYLPRVLKSLDSFWLQRVCRRTIDAAPPSQVPDILDAHFGYPDGVAVAALARALNLPAVVTLRGVEQDYLERSPAIAAQLTAMFGALAGCIAVSYSLRDIAVAAGAPAERIRVIHNAIDRSVFRPGSRAAARAALGLAAGDVWLLAVGNLLSVKRHDVLLRAAANLTDEFPTLRLAIAGGATHEPETPGVLESLVGELGIGDRVRFLGRIAPADIVSWLQASNVFSLASRREGCCNAILEALAAGIPVAATDVGDNRYFIEPGRNGFLARPNDVESMTAALRDALRHQDWDSDRISDGLHVGQWNSVAGQVMEFFTECRARFDEGRVGASLA